MCEICHGHQNCPVCRKDEELGDCPTCEGKGSITGWDYETDESVPLPYYTTCPDCDGSGEVKKLLKKYKPFFLTPNIWAFNGLHVGDSAAYHKL